MQQKLKSKKEQLIEEIETAIKTGEPTYFPRGNGTMEARPYFFLKKFESKEEAHACSDRIRMIMIFNARVRTRPSSERYGLYVRCATTGKYNGK